MNVIVTEDAEESIRDIIDFLATKNPSGARQVYDAISVAIDRLDQLPEMWPRVSVKFEMRKRIVTDYPLYSIYFRIVG